LKPKGGQLENQLRKMDDLDCPVALWDAFTDWQRSGRAGKGIDSDSKSFGGVKPIWLYLPGGLGNARPLGIPVRT
jgi:hypothetical protein